MAFNPARQRRQQHQDNLDRRERQIQNNLRILREAMSNAGTHRQLIEHMVRQLEQQMRGRDRC